MADKIKTRSSVRDIKILDKRAVAYEKVRGSALKSKDLADPHEADGSSAPEGYAREKVQDTGKQAASSAQYNARRAIGNKLKAQIKSKDNVANTGTAGQRVNSSKGKAEAIIRSRGVHVAQSGARKTDSVLKSRSPSSKTVMKAKNVSVKSRNRVIARKSAKGVKTYQAQMAKKTVKAQKQAVQRIRAAQRAARNAKRAAVAAARAVKALIAAVRSLISAIAAGGWVAVLAAIIICMIGLLVGSVFGIFFSGEDSGNGYAMPMAIQKINQQYADKITEIRNSNAHDDVVMSGSRAGWKEILAVYAVKINTDPENPQDVATMDEQKMELLAQVFWDMNVLDYHTETKEVTEVTVEGDGEDFTSTETTVTKTILYITVNHKTAQEMAEQYGFSAEQKAQLAELLSDEYADLWSAVLYGIHNGSGDIVAVAVSQIGNVNGEPYWSWYGFGSRVAWCATFVSWCANECGYIDAGIIPKFAACESQGIVWFKERSLWQEPGYVPAPGDIIFFDWEQNGHSDHVGIVEYVEGNVVHTVEGNTSNSVARRSYRLDSNSICGYGTPMY